MNDMRNLKYYQYISNSKVDMLLPQIPDSEKELLAVEFKVNLHILSAGIKSETTSYDNQVVRLKAVEKYIRKKQDCGNIKENKTWIASILDLKTCQFYGNGKVTFLIHRSDDLIFVLGGSSRNFIGNEDNENIQTSFSYTSRLLNTFIKGVDLDKRYFDSDPGLKHFLSGSVGAGDDPGRYYFKLFEFEYDKIITPAEKMDFLCKSLITGQYNGKKAILATPLYVALEN